MIQLLGLRSFTKDGQLIRYDAFFEKEWRAESIEALFADPAKHLAQIPEPERWNIFYTLATCGAGKREFKRQGVIAFDLDGIDNARHDDYIAITLAALGLRRDDTGIVASGNGLHFLIGLAEPIGNKQFFKDLKPQYRALCEKINQALGNVGLPGKADPAIFEPRRILRMPGTTNRKPNKPDTLAKLIQGRISPVAFDLEKISGLPRVKEKEQLPENYLRKYPSIDEPAVLAGCDFLKYAEANPAKINEPAWYACLSIVGRFQTKEAAHNLSKGHKGYTPAETDAKLAQALESSGPRTCESISGLWNGCSDCPNFQKVKSPIMLRGGDYIESEGTGFHKLVWKADGSLGKAIPDYEGLRRYFERLHPYVNLGDSRITLVYREKRGYYEPMGNATIESFAQEHFSPDATSNMTREFRELIARTNIKPIEWFTESTDGYHNFKNGTLDLKTNEFLSHDPSRGFRYALPFDYDPAATCPTYDKTMDKIMQGREDEKNLLEQYFGYCIHGGPYWIHKALVMVGDGANGKSTLINLLRHMVGAGNHSSMSMLDLQDSEYNRHLVDGKLFNVSEETQVRALVDSSMFKRMVGGGVIQMRKPYKDSYEVENRAKLIITCNQLPANADPSHGFWRRLLLVHFYAVFSSKDPDFDPLIDEKLSAELPGVYNRWSAKYLEAVKNRCFTECQSVALALKQYATETDNVKRWVEENIEYYDNGSLETKFMSISDLYASYAETTEAENEKPLAKNAFGKRLAKLIKDYEKRFTIKKIDKKVMRGLYGVDIVEGVGLAQVIDINSKEAATLSH